MNLIDILHVSTIMATRPIPYFTRKIGSKT